MSIFELIVYLGLCALLIPVLFSSMMDFVDLERSLEQGIDSFHAALILQI